MVMMSMKRSALSMTNEIRMFGPWSYGSDNFEITPTVAPPLKIDVGQHQIIKTEIAFRRVLNYG